jgi:hypothetical protein
MTTEKLTIEDLRLKENWLVALNFPSMGIVAFRVMALEQNQFSPYLVNYSTTQEPFDADQWKDAAKIPHPADPSIDNIFEVKQSDVLYQVFYGIKGVDNRAYMQYPSGKPRRNLSVKAVYMKADYGYVDGRMSPYNDPKPCSEIWIPRNIDIAFSWYNNAAVQQDIITKWIINMYKVQLIRDVDLLDKIIKRKVECRIVTLGGIESFQYDPVGVWNVNPVKFTDTKDEIAEALCVTL